MGGQQKTVKNLKVVEVDKARRLIFVQGSVMGNRNGIVSVRKSFGHGNLFNNYKHPKVTKITFERKA